MIPLLELALDAHGGLPRWHQVESIDLKLSIGGQLWHAKGLPKVSILRYMLNRAESWSSSRHLTAKIRPGTSLQIESGSRMPREPWLRNSLRRVALFPVTTDDAVEQTTG